MNARSHLRLVPHGLLEVALREELGVDELGRLLGVGPVLGLRSIGDDSNNNPIKVWIRRLPGFARHCSA